MPSNQIYLRPETAQLLRAMSLQSGRAMTDIVHCALVGEPEKPKPAIDPKADIKAAIAGLIRLL